MPVVAIVVSVVVAVAVTVYRHQLSIASKCGEHKTYCSKISDVSSSNTRTRTSRSVASGVTVQCSVRGLCSIFRRRRPICRLNLTNHASVLSHRGRKHFYACRRGPYSRGTWCRGRQGSPCDDHESDAEMETVSSCSVETPDAWRLHWVPDHTCGEVVFAILRCFDDTGKAAIAPD